MTAPAKWNRLAELAGDRLKLEAPLAPLTSFGVGGAAKALITSEAIEEISLILRHCAALGLPYYVLGAGSNLLVLDEGFNGLIIKLGQAFKKTEPLGENILKAGAGATGTQVMETATGLGLAGLECLAGIPCTIGGALCMNAGAGGASLGDVVSRIFYLDADGQYQNAGPTNLQFEYRRLAGLPEGSVILSAEIHLTKAGGKSAVNSRVKEILKNRAKSQPKGVRTAGCMFKNPPEGSAGRLIDECGLKGLTQGKAQVSDVHANFIVNLGGASSGDILALMEQIITEVKTRTGVNLTPEIKILGLQGEVSYESAQKH